MGISFFEINALKQGIKHLKLWGMVIPHSNKVRVLGVRLIGMVHHDIAIPTNLLQLRAQLPNLTARQGTMRCLVIKHEGKRKKK